MLEAVLATSAFPGVFPHVEIGDHYLVDGGVLNNLPLDLAVKLGAKKTVAIDVAPRYPDGGSNHSPTVIEHLPQSAQDVYRTVMLMIHALTEARLERKPPDILVKPDIQWDVGIFSGFPRAAEIIRAGERAAEMQVAELQRLVRKTA